jgi:hypothetical protein
MSHTKVIAPNIRANYRDSGEISGYRVRVYVGHKENCASFKEFDEAVKWRDKMLAKQEKVQIKKQRTRPINVKAADQYLKGWGYV